MCACLFVCHMSQKCLRKLAAHCIPCSTATHALYVPRRRVQIKYRIELPKLAMRLIKIVQIAFSYAKKKKWQKRGKVAGKMKGKLDTAFEGEPFTHFLGYTFCETGRSERTQYWLNIFGFEEQRVQLVVVASKIFQVAGQVTPERESRCRCVC